jgi:hypothetical protein
MSALASITHVLDTNQVIVSSISIFVLILKSKRLIEIKTYSDDPVDLT